MNESLGRRFVSAVARRDLSALSRLLTDDVDFRGLTPGRMWEATTRDGLVDAVLGHWFSETDHVREVLELREGSPVVDTHHIGYRFEVVNHGGPHLVEQQMYYRERDGLLDYVRIMCSGYRPRS